MAKVREISYYAPLAGGYDQSALAEMTTLMKKYWGGEVVFGTVFSGAYAGHGYTQIDFDSWEAFANLQDNWASHAEWVAFLKAVAPKVTALTSREIIIFN